LKALNYKIDARGGQGKLTEKLVASGSTVLAVDTGSKHVEIVCNIDLATHVVGTKKCSISCLFAMRKLFLIYIVLMNLLTSQALAEPHDTAILQGLNKVTARVLTIEARLGDTKKIGSLEIIVRACDKRPPEETPESAAFIDVWEVRAGEPASNIFRGWMFASSPALSALEHPVYDVWVLNCKNTQ